MRLGTKFNTVFHVVVCLACLVSEMGRFTNALIHKNEHQCSRKFAQIDYLLMH